MWLIRYLFCINIQLHLRHKNVSLYITIYLSMFRHKGKSRSYRHNLRLASLLSFVAGIVNITGLLSLGILTTNVTGHFAYFSRTVIYEDLKDGVIYLFFLLSFLLGAFCSNLLSEITVRAREHFSYIVPIAFEISLLFFVAMASQDLVTHYPDILACMMLFAMGLQNALVTNVSQSVVRTTHLTGLFTDLGIELSRLLFYRKSTEAMRLKKSIYLKIAIISFFFLGGITGGLVYLLVKIKVLIVACLCLIAALTYDYLLLKIHTISRHIKHH